MKQKLAGTLSMLALMCSTGWIPSQSAYAIGFNPPPNQDAPSQATGGASRGTIQFVPPERQKAPNQGTGGASRGSLFTPPVKFAPNSSVGGASRGNLFTPKPRQSSPNQTTGGASRGELFTPVSGKRASRGELFTPVSGKGTPQSAASAASRDGSYYLNHLNASTGPAAILAVVPQTYFGTTVSERPTILVYLPESGAKEAIFSLKDDAGNTLHQMTLPVSGKAGVVSIQVPTTLKVEQNYQWFLALKLDEELSPRTPYVDGWIQRIQPNPEVAKAMQEKDLLKQAEAFGKHGVWYDCVATLAKLQAEEPNNKSLNQHWSELLASVGLKDIDQVPVIVLKN
ncbi:MAG: DUF928 domain-containing protein [Nostocaceae cyanobacterium]|nr:DUF928 domain-containing protein [Nostocaceae cyanobacterium]